MFIQAEHIRQNYSFMFLNWSLLKVQILDFIFNEWGWNYIVLIFLMFEINASEMW